jgi:hypothetical protein
MSGYSPNHDDITLAYMRNFYAGGADPTDTEADRFRDYAPNGDASNAMPLEMVQVTEALNPSTDCGAKDRSFAAGRNWIARKDKSLTKAFDAYESGNYVEARAQFEKGWAKLGYEEAAMMLGRIHLLGLGTPASTPKALEWLHKVTDARYDPSRDDLRFDPKKPDVINTRVETALLLARIHLTGHGTKRDPMLAYNWWRKALDYGFEPAGTLLAQAHLSGVGTQVDVKSALARLQTAAEVGDTNALYMLGQLYHHQLPKQPDGVPLDIARAGAYFGAAAKAGHVDATYAAAHMLDLGEGAAAPAPDRALVLYKDAALKGHPDAQNALATYFYRGEIVEKNLGTARQFFKAAAERRQPDAMFNLAVMLAQGQGGDRDLAAAYAWCSLSKRLGHEQAANALPLIAAKLSPEEKARANALLKPAPKKS